MKWNHSTAHCASTWLMDIIFCSLPSLRGTSKPDLDSIFLQGNQNNSMNYYNKEVAETASCLPQSNNFNPN